MTSWVWSSFEVAVLMAVAVVVLRLLVKRPVRRELMAHPVASLGALVVGLIGTIAVIWLVLPLQLLRHALAAGLATLLLVASIGARPQYGSRRGLPPGSLSLAESLEAIEDPDYYSRTSERWGPVFKMRQIHQPVACITDLEMGLDLFRSQGDRLRQSDWAFNRLVPGGYLEYMDGERHTRARDVLLPAFTGRTVAESREVIRDVTRAQLAAMAASGPEGCHPEPFLLPMAQTSLIRMVLGVGPTDPDFASLRDRFTVLNRSLELFLPIPGGSREAYDWLTEKVAELAEVLRATEEGVGPTHGSSVLANLVRASPTVGSDPTVIGNLVLMVKEGSIMVRGLLRWIMKMLADHPEVVRRIREAGGDPAGRDALATAFVSETIRLFESPYVYRRVVEDVEVGGFRIPRGWLVRLCLREVHRDPGVFVDPDTFEPDRHLTAVAGRGSCPFGSDDRTCPGESIALEIAATVVGEAAVGYEVSTIQDGQPWRINRHWGLWRPSRSLRIAVRERPTHHPEL